MEGFNLREVPKLVASVLIVFFSGAIGSLATYPEITTWYVALAKPSWTPPQRMVRPHMVHSLHSYWNCPFPGVETGIR